MTSAEALQAKRQERCKESAEVFTPHTLVNQMLDKLPAETWKPGKTFCDPAAGNGNMLIHVLYRKIAVHDHDPLEALESVYGVDIMQDNIRECRLRLLKIISLFTKIKREHVEAVFTNIVWLNKKKYPQGSLQYDFSFRRKFKPTDVDRWMDWIKHDDVLDEVTLPVSAEENKGGLKNLFAAENE